MKTKILFVALLVAAFLPFSANAQAVYSVEEMAVKAPTLVGQTVQIKGLASHVCAVTGRKLFLTDSDGEKLLRVNAGNDIAKFDKAIVDSTVIATGVVTENRTYLTDLKNQLVAVKEATKAQKKLEHCDSEAKAEGMKLAATPTQRINEQIANLKKQIKSGGVDYLANYTINDCNIYAVTK
ncbi:MAG: hypothetical protein NTY32_08920 [Bacteroidia bacterium]|nr:hypothetical protein [Bacteroidia bacterium]